LQSFIFARPRIDVDLVNDPENLYGQKTLGLSINQEHPEPIPIPLAVHDFEFYWNYKLRIKNNSSKTAYNIKIESIYKTPIDYLEKIDELASLNKDGESIELNYKIWGIHSEPVILFYNLFKRYGVVVDRLFHQS
jgi:hypothetical protein